MTERCLLIGGMGFIGLHTARAFLDAGQDIVVTYNQNRREPDFLKADLGQRVLVEQLDVTDARAVEDVVKKHQVESIVYLAVPALAGVSPADEFKTNTQGYLNVLEAGRQARVRRITVTSSVAIYSNVKTAPWREDMDLPVGSLDVQPAEPPVPRCGERHVARPAEHARRSAARRRRPRSLLCQRLRGWHPARACRA